MSGTIFDGWKSLQWPQRPSEAIFHQRAQSAPPRPLGMSKYSGRDRVKPMSKNQNDDNDYLRLFSIVFSAVESDSGVKWSLKLAHGPKKEDLEA